MKLSRTDKKKIMDAHKDGLTQEELALLFGVSQPTISRVLRNTGFNSKVADRMERFLGGATVDDGCYHHPQEHKIPDAFVDYNDPLSILIAEEELKDE